MRSVLNLRPAVSGDGEQVGVTLRLLSDVEKQMLRCSIKLDVQAFQSAFSFGSLIGMCDLPLLAFKVLLCSINFYDQPFTFACCRVMPEDGALSLLFLSATTYRGYIWCCEAQAQS